MFYKRTLAKALAMAALSGIIATGTIFAAGEPTSLDADRVEYDMATGVVTAAGDVLMVQGDLKVTGQQAQYNSKTKEGKVEGNVIAVQSAKNMRVTAQKVTSDAQQHSNQKADIDFQQFGRDVAGDDSDQNCNK